jgi:predicted nucleic acid-binding protein
MTEFRPNVVDSSAWLAWFANAPAAAAFAEAIERTDALVVPTIVLTRVFKAVLRQSGVGDALQAVAFMRQGRVIDLDADLALSAAMLGEERKLALANSIIYATARDLDAILWTQDEDFEGLPNVRYVPKKR